MTVSSLKTTRKDIKSLINEAQHLFQQAASATGESADALRSKALEVLDTATSAVQSVQASAVETGKEIAVSTDQFVQKNPWKAIAMSASIGLLLGAVLARK